MKVLSIVQLALADWIRTARAQCTSTLPLAGGQLKVAEKTLAGHIEWRGKRRQVLGIVPFGGAEGTRTPGLLRAREALSQLSYSPICKKHYSNKGFYSQSS